MEITIAYNICQILFNEITMEYFGKLLTQGLKSIAALEKVDLTDLQNELGRDIGVSVWTIYKWRKGTSIPNDDRTIALLARACIGRGRMDKQWLSDFLRSTIYSNKQALIEELFLQESAIKIIHNLPRRQHKILIGREQELTAIRNFLSPQHRVGVICISGGGGVGKTALALEVAHSCHENGTGSLGLERFDAIIWVTAKSVELLPAGKIQRQATFTDLDSVYRAIADLLDLPAVFRTATQAEQTIIVMHALADKRILLMLDNLEDVDDNELLVFLRELPAPSKAVITTRHRIDVAVPIHLRTLDDTTARELVRLECERHQLNMSSEQVMMLLQRTGGLPLAIIRTLGRMAWRGSNVETEVQHLNDWQNDIYDFCFAKTVALIYRGDAYFLFMSLAIFATDIRREALGEVAGFGENALRRDEGLSDLEVLSLSYKDGDHFGLEALTRTQALAELSRHPEFEKAARERWIKWCLILVTNYGGRDQFEMHLRYDYLEASWSNILSALHWCIENGRYDEILTAWNNIRDFTHIYGFWSDRLYLLNWLIVEADNRRDYATVIRLMYDSAFTLSLTGPSTRLEEADALLQRCWLLRDYASFELQARVAALIASIYIKQGKYAKAHEWLDTGETLLSGSQLAAVERAREHASMLFDRGDTWFTMGEYSQAQIVFEQMLQEAEKSGWQRSILHAQNWLAYTALLQKNPTFSEQTLLEGWAVAKRIKEQRLTAYFKRTFAYYYTEVGKYEEAIRWAHDALDSFKRLGMPSDIHQMREFIEKLPS
jgi:tetratricopeptide (TPR) repeat protein